MERLDINMFLILIGIITILISIILMLVYRDKKAKTLFKQGETEIGDANWTKRIYKNFCKGEPCFGANTTNAMEAILIVIKIHNPDKYNFALTGLKRTIETYRNKGRKLNKLTEMYERISGDKI